MNEYLSFREEVFLNYLKKVYNNGQHVSIVIPESFENVIPFNNFNEIINTALALQIRNYVNINNINNNLNEKQIKVILTEKALNRFNNPHLNKKP